MFKMGSILSFMFILGLSRSGFAQNDAGLAAPMYSWTDLVINMTTPQVGPVNGTLGASYVLLSSMSASESTLGKVVIGCTTFVIHSHPRGTEQSMVLQGPLTIGYMFENGTSSNTTVQTGEFMVFPEGIFHFQSNQGCETASFAISFPVSDPGTMPATVAFAAIPESLQMLFFNHTFISMSAASAVGPFVEDAACVTSCQQAAAASASDEGAGRRRELLQAIGRQSYLGGRMMK
ncbi:hypothetical protein CEUSTIGMA_g8302.t1 [Chlamydomonas eustigma]|uniref:Germin-like protein n=1 Tax=Chlamydomonas eustigma TaxID=1157962 RepID=A0A250XCQ0_9CHLO|nr:hypothetical protein CEUSTIGMA_g8302.t1 [Chlamydomonas eustigma]|eukprot:GAX80867.1 hypothetical protein CEUSTIGMA_g8302.t1 [Chlamydomonas eustigma]